jgi:hypothetical protein
MKPTTSYSNIDKVITINMKNASQEEEEIMTNIIQKAYSHALYEVRTR